MLELDRLRNLDLDRPDLEELVYLSSVATALHAEFDKQQVDVPEWLDSRIRDLKKQIRSRTEDMRDARVREIRARIDSLKTPGEKRKALEEELAKLEGRQPEPVPQEATA